MPLSVAALISGMTTLVATAPNLVVNSELERHGVPGFSFFSFTPFGLPILVLGIIYMIFARRWLRAGGEERGETRRELRGLDRGIQTRRPRISRPRHASVAACRARRSRSWTCATPPAQASLPSSAAANSPGNCFPRRRRRRSRSSDVLLIDLFSRDKNIKSREMDIEAIEREFALEELPLSGAYFTDRSQEIGMAEVIVPPSSDLIGRSIVGSKFRTRFGLTVIGIRRGKVVFDRMLLAEKLKVGDTLLLVGPWKRDRADRDRQEGPRHHRSARGDQRRPSRAGQGAPGGGLPRARRRADGQRR